MIDDTKILLVGTSDDIQNFPKSFFEDKVSEGYKILSYSNSIDYLENIKAPYHYWSFIDPNSLRLSIMANRDKYQLQDKILITANLYNEQFTNYFKTGYTCNALKKRDPQNWKRVLKLAPELDNIFNQHIKHPYKVIDGRKSTPIDFRDTCYIVRFAPLDNIDKFSCYLLPLTFYSFPMAKTIDVIGFGHFKEGRWYSTKILNWKDNRKGYSEFIKTYETFKNVLRNFIIKNDIKIKFQGKPSHFAKHLEIE